MSVYAKAPRGLLSRLGDGLPVLKDFVLSGGLLFMTLWGQSDAHLHPPSLCRGSICWFVSVSPLWATLVKLEWLTSLDLI